MLSRELHFKGNYFSVVVYLVLCIEGTVSMSWCQENCIEKAIIIQLLFIWFCVLRVHKSPRRAWCQENCIVKVIIIQ